MFVHKIDEDIALKLIELRDTERVFDLTNNSRDYLKEWLPWLDYTTKLEDTKESIKMSLKGFAENKCMNTIIMYKGQIRCNSVTRIVLVLYVLDHLMS